MKFHGGVRVGGGSVGAEKRAGPDQIVGELMVLTHIAVNGLRFVWEGESTGVASRDRESVAVGEGKAER